MIAIDFAPINVREKQLLLDMKAVITSSLSNCDVFLYGSRAKGTHDPESDYNILVISEEELSREEEREIRNRVFDFELDREVVFSLVFRSRKEWQSPLEVNSPFFSRVQREAVML